MAYTKPSFLKICTGISFSTLLALGMSPTAHAQTTYLTAQENATVRIETAGKLKEASASLLSNLLACVATASPADQLKKLTAEFEATKALRHTFVTQREKINANIADIQKRTQEINLKLAVNAAAKPTAKDFRAVSERMQSANAPYEIQDPIKKEFSFASSPVVELLKSNTVISFTDSSGKRRLASGFISPERVKLDAEQRAVLEAVALTWMVAPTALTNYENKKEKIIQDKNPLRAAKVNASSFSDVDAAALVAGANTLIPKAGIMIEASRGQSLQIVGKKVASHSESLARMLSTSGVTAAKVAEELRNALPRIDVEGLQFERKYLHDTMVRLNNDADSFYQRTLATDSEFKRLEIEFKKCSAKLAPAPTKAPLTKIRIEAKRDVYADDVEAYEKIKEAKKPTGHNSSP